MKIRSFLKVSNFNHFKIIFLTVNSLFGNILYTSMTGHDVSHFVLDSQHTHHGALSQKHLSLPEISFK
ncbi:hypothetical protein HU219_11030 [Staphylococcus sp. SS35]|nr:hypothetical protein [Staphylococcus singaporensis]